MSIQAVVLLPSYLPCPCQVSPHPHSPRLFISPGSVTSRLGWQCHSLPLTPPLPPPSFIPQHTVTHRGGRSGVRVRVNTTLSPQIYLPCSQSTVFWGRDHARSPCVPAPHGSASGSRALGSKASVSSPISAFPSPSRPYSSHTVRTACENCDFFKRLQLG